MSRAARYPIPPGMRRIAVQTMDRPSLAAEFSAERTKGGVALRGSPDPLRRMGPLWYQHPPCIAVSCLCCGHAPTCGSRARGELLSGPDSGENAEDARRGHGRHRAEVSIEISDDGRGFDPSASSAGHMGLQAVQRPRPRG